MHAHTLRHSHLPSAFMLTQLVYIVVLASVVSMLTAYAKATAIHRDYMTTISLFCSTRHISNALRRRWFLFVHEDWRLFRGISATFP